MLLRFLNLFLLPGNRETGRFCTDNSSENIFSMVAHQSNFKTNSNITVELNVDNGTNLEGFEVLGIYLTLGTTYTSVFTLMPGLRHLDVHV